MREDTDTAKEETLKFEADYVPKVGRRRHEVGEFTNTLREKVAIVTDGLKELATVYAEWESHNAKADLLDEALIENRKEVAPI